jgi:hypothetical protein
MMVILHRSPSFAPACVRLALASMLSVVLTASAAAQGTWVPIPNDAPRPLSDHSATLLPHGRLLVIDLRMTRSLDFSSSLVLT